MFECTRQGAVDLVRGASPLNQDTSREVAGILDRCLEHGQPRIIFDLDRVPLIDSKGLELLVDYQKHCIKLGGCMKLASPGVLCRDILNATNVVSHFEVFDNVIAATGSFAQ